MKWLDTCEKQDGIFPANHWVDGRKYAHRPWNPLWIPQHASDDFDDHGNAWITPNMPTDTAFQILKVAAYADLVEMSRDERQQDPRLIELEAEQHDSDLTAIQERVAAWAESWLKTLRSFDKRGSFAWPHAKNKSSREFRLDDHLWIWMAIKSFEHPSLRVWSSLRAKQISWRFDPWSFLAEDHLGWLCKSFAAKKIQREISDRFTTWKDNSNVRMLAVERSLQRTRVSFDFGDTALFYAQDLGFFRTGDQSVYEPWLETITSQARYESSQDSELDASLRCGFEILLQTSNCTHISREYGSLQQLDATMEVVLGIMESNGFFPVKLDVVNKDPLTCCQHDSVNGVFFDVDDYFRSSFELPFILISSVDVWSQPQTSSYDRPVPDDKRIGPSRLSKPLLHPQTPQNIVDIEDEWLFDYPLFFDNEVRLDLASERSRPELEGTVFHELTIPADSASRSKTSPSGWLSEAPESSPTVIDIQGAVQEGALNTLIYEIFDGLRVQKTPEVVAKAFESPRTAATAKKRLVHLCGADLMSAFLCYASTIGQEKDNILWFFQRHSDRLNYLHDDCARVSNKWETELHLSFHQIVKDDKPRPLAQIADFCGKWSEIISRAAIGFRFDGDLFDKYWTATVIQSLASSKSPQPLFIETIVKEKSTNWRQRKVLELKILSTMLSKAHECTAKIFDDVKCELKVDQDFSIFSRKPDSDNYDVLSSRWRAFEPILQVLEEDLLEIEEHIGQWNRREDERGYVRPRWTPEQEREYRGDINKQVRVVRSWTNKVRHLRNDVQRLRLFFKDQLTNTREELDFQNSNNITYFTYVTIVFAPLGFGAGIFSTSGPPSVAALQGVVMCATVALMITAVVLINARLLVNGLKLILKHLRIMTNVAKEASLMYSRTNIEEESRANNGIQAESPYKNQTIKGLGYLNFWLAYLLLELPAKRVASAYRILTDRRERISSQVTSVQADPERASKAAVVCDKQPITCNMDRIISVLTGFGLLPMVSITWVLQLILYTIADLLIYSGGK